ncbi:MAG: pseudaminic acid synthase [Bacteriovorax sp.]|jgi:N-acetylneuraminate synthase
MSEIKIGNRFVGKNHPPFIIAEMSGNHNHSLERAFQIIEAAAKAGAHALKIQTYTPETMTLNLNSGEFLIEDKNSLWNGRNLYDLYGEAHTPWDWHGPIFDKCKSLGLIYLSTPFDATAVDFLETFNPPVYKIASFENTDIPLIKKVAQTKKPMIISTGMASVAELELTVKTALENGCRDLILLKCTSSYPSTPKNTNILTIPHLRDLFKTEVGLSDHTMGVGAACASVALGATVIEKHFTLKRSDGGVDSAFSLEPHELELLVVESKRAWEAMGEVSYGVTEAEKKSLIFRRSIYIAEDVKEGDVLNEKNLRCIRPGYGLPPKYYEMLLGKKIKGSFKKGTAMKMEYVL